MVYCAKPSVLTRFFYRFIVTVVLVYSQNVASQSDRTFECPIAVGSGSFADPASCRRFYQCVDGYPYTNRCPSGLYFDDISKFCTFKKEARCGPIASTPPSVTDDPTERALNCDLNECKLPYCFCSKDGTTIPGGLQANNTPQMILLTFDGAINLNNYDHYRNVFAHNRQNPNGCPIKGTFFVSHEYSNYRMIQTLAKEGHEFGTHTISLQEGLQNKGYEEWVGEMVGMRQILNKFSNISQSEVVGMRAPYLKPGRNTQYRVLEDFGYIYDSSLGTPSDAMPIWPYTLDYKIPHECKSSTCPTRSFPGVWELPLNAHFVRDFEGGHCPYLDQCVLHNYDAKEVFEWLREDFERHYKQNRAPYMMAFHTNWFSILTLEKGLKRFLDWAVTLPDVWFVTATKALMWMTDPRGLDRIESFEPWSCSTPKKNIPQSVCSTSRKCPLSFKIPENNISETRYLETCVECPNKYPWLGDTSGSGIPGKDNYTPTDNSPK